MIDRNNFARSLDFGGIRIDKSNVNNFSYNNRDVQKTKGNGAEGHLPAVSIKNESEYMNEFNMLKKLQEELQNEKLAAGDAQTAQKSINAKMANIDPNNPIRNESEYKRSYNMLLEREKIRRDVEQLNKQNFDRERFAKDLKKRAVQNMEVSEVIKTGQNEMKVS